MGVQSRGYMSSPCPEGRLWKRRSLVSWIILVNVAVFVLWQFALQSRPFELFLSHHFMISADGLLQHFRVHTLVTHAFSHMELWHALWNLLFVWWFGRELEDMYGARDFAVLYFGAAIVAGLAHVAMQSWWGAPGGSALGASGAVMGIVIVYACFFPDRPMYVFGVFPIAIKWLAVLYVGSDLLGLVRGEQDRIGHAAHLGGAVFGLLYWKFDLRIFAEGARFRWSWLRRRPAPIAREPHPETREPDPKPSLDPGLSARVDELLDKIARDGIGSLTPDERAFLDSASRHYRS